MENVYFRYLQFMKHQHDFMTAKQNTIQNFFVFFNFSEGIWEMLEK